MARYIGIMKFGGGAGDSKCRDEWRLQMRTRDYELCTYLKINKIDLLYFIFYTTLVTNHRIGGDKEE